MAKASKRTQRVQTDGISRRNFLRRTSVAAVGALTFPYIIPASARGVDGHVAPSNRIVMGCLGVGSQGTGNMKGFLGFKEAQIVAVCDVDRGHRDAARDIVNQAYGNSDCATHDDFRDLMDRGDLDALSIAVPDHWHSIPAIAGAKKGLDMYAEKPLSLTIREGQAMVNAINRYGVVWQTGSWQRSRANFHRGAELVRNGRIGHVHTVEVGLPTGKGIEPQPVMPIPDGFDYNFWLGPAPDAPYTEKRCHWDFRWIFDYSGGQLTDWAAHHCDIANWGMGTESTGPVSVKGKGEFPAEGLWNTAINYTLECKFAPGASPVAPDGFTMMVSNGFPMGCRWKGSEGELFVDRGDVIQANHASVLDSVIGPDEVHLYKSEDHAQNFFDGVRSRKPCVAPIHAAHRAISIAHLGNIAMRLEREVAWDPATETFVNDPEATRFLERAMRGPWHL
jgi:predicted dehydrogenase